MSSLFKGSSESNGLLRGMQTYELVLGIMQILRSKFAATTTHLSCFFLLSKQKWYLATQVPTSVGNQLQLAAQKSQVLIVGKSSRESQFFQDAVQNQKSTWTIHQQPNRTPTWLSVKHYGNYIRQSGPTKTQEHHNCRKPLATPGKERSKEDQENILFIKYFIFKKKTNVYNFDPIANEYG